MKRAAARKDGRSRRNGIGPQLIRAVTQLRDALERGEPLEQLFTVRVVEVPEPGWYTPRMIRRVRDDVSASQAVFARMMGVSPQLVEHWEQGLRKPQPWARRLLDLAARDRTTFMRLVMPREVAGNALQSEQRFRRGAKSRG